MFWVYLFEIRIFFKRFWRCVLWTRESCDLTVNWIARFIDFRTYTFSCINTENHNYYLQRIYGKIVSHSISPVNRNSTELSYIIIIDGFTCNCIRYYFLRPVHRAEVVAHCAHIPRKYTVQLTTRTLQTWRERFVLNITHQLTRVISVTTTIINITIRLRKYMFFKNT